jgi:hypothetical protein
VSDFFAALADRARETPLVVRPRLAAQFEDAAPGAVAVPSDFDLEHVIEEIVPAPHTRHAAQPAPPAAFDEARVSTDMRVHSPVTPVVERVVAVAAPRTAAHNGDAKFAPVGAARDAEAPRAAGPAPHQAAAEIAEVVSRFPAPAPPAQLPLPARAEVRAPDIAARERAAREATVQPRVRRSSEPVTPVAEPARRATEIAPRDGEVQPKLPVPDGVREARAIVPAVVRAPATAPAPSRASAPPAETTVHVTIGRIEVRAVAEAANRRPEPKPSPVMSLEDYLRSRSAQR